MSDTQTTLTTVPEVIAALGGTPAVQSLTTAETPQVVSNWSSRNRFAAHTFVIITDALQKRGLEADPLLWGMTPLPSGEPAASEPVG